MCFVHLNNRKTLMCHLWGSVCTYVCLDGWMFLYFLIYFYLFVCCLLLGMYAWILGIKVTKGVCMHEYSYRISCGWRGRDVGWGWEGWFVCSWWRYGFWRARSRLRRVGAAFGKAHDNWKCTISQTCAASSGQLGYAGGGSGCISPWLAHPAPCAGSLLPGTHHTSWSFLFQNIQVGWVWFTNTGWGFPTGSYMVMGWMEQNDCMICIDPWKSKGYLFEWVGFFNIFSHCKDYLYKIIFPFYIYIYI